MIAQPSTCTCDPTRVSAAHDVGCPAARMNGATITSCIPTFTTSLAPATCVKSDLGAGNPYMQIEGRGPQVRVPLHHDAGFFAARDLPEMGYTVLALKALHERCDKQAKTIAALEARLAALEARQ